MLLTSHQVCNIRNTSKKVVNWSQELLFNSTGSDKKFFSLTFLFSILDTGNNFSKNASVNCSNK